MWLLKASESLFFYLQVENKTNNPNDIYLSNQPATYAPLTATSTKAKQELESQVKKKCGSDRKQQKAPVISRHRALWPAMGRHPLS
jgi:hypothetical protein